ncbi:hypothetical protein MMC26_003304 [Xylographa opegraphella]|nr:hypothetical protein [Xylographa opegraphella]
MPEQPGLGSFSPAQHTHQLALAVNLVKTKPSSSSVKDYIQNLRQYLVSDSVMTASSELKALRDEARQLREENKNLRDENKDFREENKDLREENKRLRQQYQPIPAQGGSSRPNTKRKRNVTDVLATSIEPGAAFVLEELEIYLPSAEG